MDIEIENKAKDYAINALSEHINIIAEAYMAGYREGITNLKDNKNRNEETTLPEYNYLDFNLPSGNKWAFVKNTAISYLDYLKQNYNLPSKEDILELAKYCKIHKNSITSRSIYHPQGVYSMSFDIITPSGEKYVLEQLVPDASATIRFWLKNQEVDENGKVLSAALKTDGSIECSLSHQVDRYGLVLVQKNI